MSPFVRFILMTIALGVVLNLTMVMFSNVRSTRSQRSAAKAEEEHFYDVIKRFDDRQRRMDMLVNWQKIDARGRVLETSLLVRRYLLGKDGTLEPTPLVRVLIPGDRVGIDGMRLTFTDDFDPEYAQMRGVSLAYFDHVFAPEQRVSERFSFQKSYNVPYSTRVHPKKESPTHFEIRIWNRIWEIILSPRKTKSGLEVINDVPAFRTVRNGALYSAYLGKDGVSIEPREDTKIVSDILEEAEEAEKTSERPGEGVPGVRVVRPASEPEKKTNN